MELIDRVDYKTASLEDVSYFFTALRIHISESTKKLLNQIGGFRIEERGLITIKVHEI